MIDSHSRALATAILPALFEDLRTQNAAVRLELQRTVLALAKADFSFDTAANSDLESWAPSKDESPAQIDAKVARWYAWWKKASTT